MITAAVMPSSAQSVGTRMNPAIVAPMFGIMSSSAAITPRPTAKLEPSSHAVVP
jgi:hypothetical protein